MEAIEEGEKEKMKTFINYCERNVNFYIKSSECLMELFQKLLTSEKIHKYFNNLFQLFCTLKNSCKQEEPKTKRIRVSEAATDMGVDNPRKKIGTNKSMAVLTVNFFHESKTLKQALNLMEFENTETFTVLTTLTSKAFTFLKAFDKHPEKFKNYEENELIVPYHKLEDPSYLLQNYANESDTGLYLIGGGAIGEIYGRTGRKGRKWNKKRKISPKQKIKDDYLFKCTDLVKMNDEEKQRDLPIELKIRDIRNKLCYQRNVFCL